MTAFEYRAATVREYLARYVTAGIISPKEAVWVMNLISEYKQIEPEDTVRLAQKWVIDYLIDSHTGNEHGQSAELLSKVFPNPLWIYNDVIPPGLKAQAKARAQIGMVDKSDQIQTERADI